MNTAEKVAEAVPDNDSDPLLGMVINQKFKITQAIAVGGMGTIYRGEQLVLARPVAIKALNPAYTANLRDPAFQKRFFLEASILSRLQHPNIVTVFDYGRIDGLEHDRFFMAMEFLPGETLHRRLRSRGWLTPPEALGIARQLARGLREAHKHGVVHRDMKPSNVMLVPDEDGVEIVKILDFGLGKVLSDDSEELTQQGSFLGSPRYMSPEQIAHGKVDHRTDVYSLGVMLYQMLCGKVPFESDKSVQILIAHLQSPVPPMKQRNPDVDVPEPIENFVRRCLEKSPDARPSNMDEFIRQLRECASTMGLTAGFGVATSVTLDSVPMSGAHLPSGEVVGVPHPPQPVAPADEPEVMLTSGSHAEVSLDEEVEEVHAPPRPAARPSGAHHPAARPVAPAAVPPRRHEEIQPASSRFGMLVGAAGIVLIFAAFIVLAMRQPPVQTTVQGVQPTPQRPEEMRSFVVMIDSYPQGADVFDGEHRLGSTPMQLSMQNADLRAQPHQLTIRRVGYLPYSIVQGPSDGNVRITAQLAPEAPAQPPYVAPQPQQLQPPQLQPQPQQPQAAGFDPRPRQPVRPRQPTPPAHGDPAHTNVTGPDLLPIAIQR
ncbi:MAG: serine/threonine-protein kinase [Polyangiales bacterium]